MGIDMDVKEILMNGFQIKAAKEFCNQGAELSFAAERWWNAVAFSFSTKGTWKLKMWVRNEANLYNFVADEALLGCVLGF